MPLLTPSQWMSVYKHSTFAVLTLQEKVKTLQWHQAITSFKASTPKCTPTLERTRRHTHTHTHTDPQRHTYTIQTRTSRMTCTTPICLRRCESQPSLFFSWCQIGGQKGGMSRGKGYGPGKRYGPGERRYEQVWPNIFL